MKLFYPRLKDENSFFLLNFSEEAKVKYLYGIDPLCTIKVENFDSYFDVAEKKTHDTNRSLFGKVVILNY